MPTTPETPAVIEPGEGGPHSPAPALAELLAVRKDAGRPDPAEVAITGADPFYPIPHRVGEATAAALAAVGVAVSDLWELRTGRRQRVEVAVAEAAASVRTADYTQQRDDAGAFDLVPRRADRARSAALIRPWETRDGRYFLPHFTLPHLQDRVLGVLDCEPEPESVAAAVARWDADDLEQAIAEARASGGTVRTREEWLAHPQGEYLSERPVVEISRSGDALPEPLPAGDRPLSGIRVLDLTRILAGPIAGRTLAEHGADVLMVTADGLPQIPEHVRDTGHGKRSTYLDLKTEEGARRLAELVRTADVVLDGYRPGRIGALGFDLDTLFALRPGLVHLKVTCYGAGGPFADRAGWDQVAQAVTGICEEEGRLTGAGRPRLMAPPACDYNTGYLGAYGVLLALGRRAREGGSYSVDVSLCQTAMYIQRQGLLSSFDQGPGRLSPEGFERRAVVASSTYGTLKTLGPVLDLSETPGAWVRTTPRLGADEPVWLPRAGDRTIEQEQR
jgi:crotonobetainyl-CoA:carnitine CoA-transferase CaiB-like acyl-CoA transferase